MGRGAGYYVAVEEMRVMVSLYVGGLDPLLQYRTLQSAGMLKPEQWNHVAVTYDGVTLKLYLDGVADASAAFEGLKEVKENTQKLRIGTGFHGLIDEVRRRGYESGELWGIGANPDSVTAFEGRRRALVVNLWART